MSRHLLDVNVLIALVDLSHVPHDDVHSARANTGRLATLDHKLATEVVADGKSSLALI